MAGLVVSDPMTLTDALASPRVIAGDTFLLRAGTYTGNYSINHSGNASRWITVRNYPGERATIDGKVTINGDYVRVIGLESTNSAARDRSEQIGTVGFDCLGDYNEIVNCVIHDHDQGITTSKDMTGHIYYGNLVYFNGWDTRFGHGIYPQNLAGNTKTIKRNIFCDNFSYGVHCYGADGNIDGFIIDGNISFENGEPRQLLDAAIINSGGVSVTNPVVRNNLTYNHNIYTDSAGAGILFGATVNAQVYDNYVVSTRYGITFSEGAGITRFDGNTIYGWLTNVSLVDWPDNSNPSGHPADPIVFPATGSHVVLQANEYDANRAQLTIYNWTLGNTVTVGVSSVYSNGDELSVHNAQDYYSDTQSLTVSGGNITVNMQAANRTVATPVGWTAPATTFPQFGCFVLEKV